MLGAYQKGTLFLAIGTSKLGHFYEKMRYFHDEMGAFTVKGTLLL